MIGDRELINTYLKHSEGIKNPNLYVQFPPMGGLWSSSIYPWQEATPWTFN